MLACVRAASNGFVTVQRGDSLCEQERALSRTHRMILWVWVGVMGIASLFLLFLAVQQSVSDVRAGGIALGFWFPTTMTVLGGLIAVRQPQNRIAWLLIGIGLAVLVEMFLQLLLSSQPTSPSWGHLVAFVMVYAALPAGLYMAFLIPWMFPDGHFYTRWQKIAWLPGALVIAAVPLVASLTENIGQPYPAEGEAWTIDNPIGFLPGSVLDIGVVIGMVVLVLTAASGVVSLARRYRGSSVVARAQIRWIALSISIVAGVLVLIVLTDASQHAVGGLLLVVAFTTMPVCIAVAITRYRLFEIDRIISRTLTYTLIVTVLAGAFFGLVTAITALLPTQDSLAVAASTLLVAALFNPLRKRVQASVDRRFNRSAHQTDAISEEFTSELQESLTIDEITQLLESTVVDHLQPTASGVWISTPESETSHTNLAISSRP